MPWLYKAFKVKRENLGRGREAVAIVHHIHFASLGTNLIGIKQGQGQYNSVQSLSRVWLFVTPWTAAHQATRSITRVYSNSCPLSRWWHPTISSSVISFSSCPQSFTALRSFPMTHLFSSGGSFSDHLYPLWQLSMTACNHFINGYETKNRCYLGQTLGICIF